MNRNKLDELKKLKQTQPTQPKPQTLTKQFTPADPITKIEQLPKIAPQTDQGTRGWKTGPQKGPRTKGSRIGKSILIQEKSDLVSLFYNDEKSVIFCHSNRSKESKQCKKIFDQFSMGVHRSNNDSNEIICVSVDFDVVATDPSIQSLFPKVPCILFKHPTKSTKSKIQRWTFASGFKMHQLCNVAAEFFKDASLYPIHPELPKPLTECRYVLIHDQAGPLVPRFVRIPCSLDGDLVDACLSVIRSNDKLNEQVATINVRQVGLSFLAIPSIFDRQNGNFYRHENALKFLLSLTGPRIQF